MKKQFSILRKGFFIVLVAFPALPAFSQSELVGSWRLTATGKIMPDGKEAADYEANPQGIAIFTSDGHYVTEIFRLEQLKFASGDPMKGTAEEYKNAYLSTNCDFGTYTVDEAEDTTQGYEGIILNAYIIHETNGTITFHTEHASYPNLDETTRVTNFTLKGDKLTWQSRPRPDGVIPVFIFKRMP